MPFIGSKITVKVSKEKKEIIKKRLGEAIELVPGKRLALRMNIHYFSQVKN